MLFFFKEKPIEIIAYTNDEFLTINEQSPISPAKEYFPDWWKKTPSSTFNWDTYNVDSTSKSCPGIAHTLQRGFILPLWSDLAIKTQADNFLWRYADGLSRLDHHKTNEAPGFYEDHLIFKLVSPWQVKSPVPILFTFPFYLFTSPLPYLTPTGIVTPVSEMVATNVFILIKKSQEESRLMIKQGTPLIHLIPLTEKKVMFRTEVLSEDEYKKMKRPTAFRNHFTARGIKNMSRNKPNK
jgi:hypothetical protein